MNEAPVLRPTARVLLIDGDRRTLLVLMNSSDGQVFFVGLYGRGADRRRRPSMVVA